MPRKIKTTRRRKLHKWAKRSKQKGGFIFMDMAAIGAAIVSAAAAAALAVTTGVVGA